MICAHDLDLFFKQCAETVASGTSK